MALWFFRGLGRQVVTTRYPSVLDPWTAALPTPPSFVPSRLTTALVHRLVESCPSGALRQEDRELVLDERGVRARGHLVRPSREAGPHSGR